MYTYMRPCDLHFYILYPPRPFAMKLATLRRFQMPSSTSIVSAMGIGIFLGVIFILTSIHLAQYGRNASWKCDDGNPCSVGLVVGTTSDLHCEFWAKPTGAECASSCFVPGAVSGQCGRQRGCGERPVCELADVKECLGYCEPETEYDLDGPVGINATCLERIVLRDPIEDPDHLTSVYAQDVRCVANQCVGMALQLVAVEADWETDDDPPLLHPALGLFTACDDLLDPDAGIDPACIQMAESTVDDEVIWSFRAWHPDFPPQVRVQSKICTYRYACGGFDRAALDGDVLMMSGAALSTSSTYNYTHANHMYIARSVGPPVFNAIVDMRVRAMMHEDIGPARILGIAVAAAAASVDA